MTPAAASVLTPSPAQRANIDRRVPAGATLLPDGRLATPAGVSTDLGDFPVGVTVSPDGVLAVAPGNGQGEGLNGGFGALCSDPKNPAKCYIPPSEIGNPATPAPDEALFVTNRKTGNETEVKAVPSSTDPAKPRFNFFAMGVQFSPDGSELYAVGGGNDAVYRFPVTNDVVAAAPAQTAYLQSVSGQPTVSSSTYQSPSTGTAAGETKGMAITPDGSALLVLKEQASELDLLNASTLALEQVVPLAGDLPVGPVSSPAVGTGVSYPYDVVLSPDGAHAYVTEQGTGTLETFAVAAGTLAPESVSLTGDHPTGESVSPDGSTLMVANANSDTVSVFALTGGVPGAAATQTVTTQALKGEAYGAVPNSVAFAAGGTRAYVALAGDDALAVLDLVAGSWSVSGMIPTGWYPTRVTVAPDGAVLVVDAKGLGSRYPQGGDYPAQPTGGLDGPAALPMDYYYDANNMPGLLQTVTVPTPGQLALDTATVTADLLFPTTNLPTDPGGPIPTTQATAGQSPITHVVYIVRENRTFDEVLGDQGTTRNDVDADPSLASFTTATPNAHAIVNRYATSDSYYSDGEASVQGHFWTTGAGVDDYVEKDWRQYYSSRNHSDDNLGAVSEAAGCTLFQSAAAKQAATAGAFTYFDFGEPVGTANPTISAQTTAGNLLPTGVPALNPQAEAQNQAGKNCAAIPDAEIDPRGFAQGFSSDNRPLATDFLTESGLNTDGTDSTAGTSGALALRNFSYVELPQDHTTGFTAGDNTPRSEIAQNDAALGQIVSALSRSKYWSSTAVFVTEDDSQDGPDHVDGHRNILLVASPYATQLSANGCYTGFVSHQHSDQASVVRTIELVLGLPALSSYDQNAAPLYDLFQNKNSPAQLTPADLAPYPVAADPPFIDETVNSLPATSSTAALVAATSGLDLSGVDKAGPGLEQVLWQAQHPGTAEPAQLVAEVARAKADAAAGVMPGTDQDSVDVGYTETPAQQAVAPQLGVHADAAADACTAPGVAGNAPPPVLASRPVAAVPGAGALAATGLSRSLLLTGAALVGGAGLLSRRRRRQA